MSTSCRVHVDLYVDCLTHCYQGPFYNDFSSSLHLKLNLSELENELCADNEKLCAHKSQCIKSAAWCDGIINCIDRSDEVNCSCKERMDKEKLCDGYFDCPDGEDEEGCFGKTFTL